MQTRIPDHFAPLNVKPARRATIATAPFEPRHEYIQVVRRVEDANPPRMQGAFDTHRRVVTRDADLVDLEGQTDPATQSPRSVPLLGQLPDNWQLGVAIGVGLGLILQFVQTGVNSSLKTGQADILAKLTG